MAFLSNFDINGYGLSAQRARINVISSNIANAQTTRTSEGGPYRRREVIFKAIDFNEQFNKELAKNSNLHEYEDPLSEGLRGEKATPPAMSVRVDKIVRDDSQPKMKFEPSHPDADARGYVAYPNINPVVEMSDLIEATRAYQANVSAFQSAKNIADSSIDLLR